MNAPTASPNPTEHGDDPRSRIVLVAAGLIAAGGRDAATTRAVAAAAGVQAPTIYRLFGDKQGLLDAVASHGFAAYLNEKTGRAPGDDPVEALRAGWDQHVGFGLANPALYALMYGDPRPDVSSPAARAGMELLAAKIQRVAASGRLRVDETRAAHLFHAAACGLILTLLALPEEQRDPTLSGLAREAALAAIVTDSPAPPAPGPVEAAITLRAVLPRTAALTGHERALLREWLDRIAAS